MNAIYKFEYRNYDNSDMLECGNRKLIIQSNAYHEGASSLDETLLVHLYVCQLTEEERLSSLFDAFERQQKSFTGNYDVCKKLI